MKRVFLCIGFLLFCSSITNAQLALPAEALKLPSIALPSELLVPEVVSINRMPMRATAFSFENKDLAAKRDIHLSANFISLNGTWKFNWVKNPQQRPHDFYKNDFNDAAWTNFKVPANWELNGYGLPIYVNHPYEFTGQAKRGKQLNPPFDIPEDNNPVGSYRKIVTIPQDWDGKQVFIHLGAVKSAFFIWVNGQKVGYSEDSKLAAEFDITKYVKPGNNLIALQVYRWSTGSYFECQDMWRISGIEREVYLYATPKLNIRDVKIISTLDTVSYSTGILQVDAEVNNYTVDNGGHSKGEMCTVEVELKDANGNIVYADKTSHEVKVLGQYKTNVSFIKNIQGVKSWSAETPYLYTLYLTLKDKKGNVLEVVPQRIGFKLVQIKDRNFLVNGKRVFLKGVNRHEHNPFTGHTLSKEDALKDMEMMKKLNINAVRHSHYPPDPYWMELCDEYGLYVVDEANIEAHGMGYDLSVSLANKPEWLEPHLQRVLRMYERDKNHASVVTWSLGNEAGNGSNFYAAYDLLKTKTSLPIQYERAEYDYNTDMIVPQYPDPNWLREYSKSNPDRLMIMSEYAHIMGNSLGNFQEYWDVIETTPYQQGGFIWEWIDQAFDTVKNGKRIMAYGGDFPLSGPVDKNLSDNNFCVKGVVTAHRGLTPMAVEVKKVYQHIKTKWEGNNKINIRNGYFFRNLDNIQLKWELIEDGIVKETGFVAEIKLAPQQSEVITLPVKYSQKADREYFINVYYNLKNAEPFLEKDYTIAYEQFSLNDVNFKAAQPSEKGALKMTNTNNTCTISSNKFSVSFDLKSGTMSSYSFKGQQLLEQGPMPGFWRAPTDNDIGARFNKSLRMWRNAYESGVINNADVDVTKVTDGQYKVVFSKKIVNGDAIAQQEFLVYADGTIKVNNQFTPGAGEHKLLMRIGNDLILNKAYDQIQWYGRGPWENYWDRKTASLIGTYKQTVKDQYFPYARPQESGNKADVRRVCFTNKAGKGLMIEMADSLLNFSALPYSMDDLDPEQDKKQYHSGELMMRDKTYLHIDLNQSGLQGIDSWGSEPLEQYRMLFKKHTYSYYMRPVE